MMKWMGDYRFLTVLGVAVVAASAMFALGSSQLTAQTNTPIACNAPATLTNFARPLSRVGRRLAAGEPISVVAIGSSSTAGAGASSPATNYPSRLAAELKGRFPLRPINVVNHGVGGTEMGDMLAKFDQDVVAEKPDLVLWQLGTNSVLRDRTFSGLPSLIDDGLGKIKQLGADVVLINPQYAPKVLAHNETDDMLKIISTAAGQGNVNLFDRFAIMRYWRVAENIPFSIFLSPDELHMNDWSYACVAKLMAGSISDAATRPAMTATAIPPAAPAR
jgi:acyl-CoA thioesterase I